MSKVKFIKRCIEGLSLLFFLSACQEIQSNAEDPYEFEKSIHALFSEHYYWNTNIPALSTFDFGAYETPSDLVQDLKKYSGKNPHRDAYNDRWSFMISKERWDSYASGNAADHGVGFKFLTETDLRISWVEPASIAGIKGVKRGDHVLSIGGIAATKENTDALNTALSNTEGVLVKLSRNDASTYTIQLENVAYEHSPVMKTAIFQTSGKKVGYMLFNDFIAKATDQFETAFTTFETEGVEELILDLRYNGGGSMSVMRDLLGYLLPKSTQDKMIYGLVHNDDKRQNNTSETVELKTQGHLSLNKISFITTASTASASEVLINALKPFVTVETIGTTTNGKLMGMYLFNFDHSYVAPIAFRTVNHNGEGDISQGIMPDVLIGDDLTNDFTAEEGMTRAALTGVVTSTARIGVVDHESAKVGQEKFNLGLYLER